MKLPRTTRGRITLAGLLFFALVLIAGLALAASQYFSRPAGEDIDVLAQCKDRYGPDTGVIGRDDSPTGWHCVTPRNEVVPFTAQDMQAACDKQHPGSVAVATNPTRSGWRCVGADYTGPDFSRAERKF